MAVQKVDVRRVERRLERAKEAIEIAAVDQLIQSANNVVALAKSLAPVGETGDLQRSIRWEWGTKEHEVVIGTNVPYAPYVEFGTRDQPARPFLLPAIKYERPIFRRTLEQRISNELRKVRRYL